MASGRKRRRGEPPVEERTVEERLDAIEEAVARLERWAGAGREIAEDADARPTA